MDPSTTPAIGTGLLAVALLVLANAFFVAAEFALVGARRTRLDQMVQAGDRKALLARRAVRSLERYISATQLGITLASLGLGWIGKPALAGLLDGLFAFLPEGAAVWTSHAVSAATAFAIITALHIVLGELVPKSLALLYPEDVSRWVAGPLIGFGWLMAGPISLLNGTATWLLGLFKIKPRGDHERLHSTEEIRMLVEQSQVGGSMETEDARLLEGVFEFSEKSAEEVMTPRTKIVALAEDLPVTDAADAIAEAGLSRYPVYVASLDEIVGVVLAKDVLRALRADPTATVGSIRREPLFVPRTREVEDVLTDMKRLKTHLAVVLDEYGGTAGLVTMEDLLEEIVGEIFDEHDEPEELPAAAGGAPLLEGAMPLSDFNDAWDAKLDDRNYTTLGGYVFGELGRLPRVGDRIVVGTRTFEIVSMEGRRVNEVRMTVEERKEASP
ncbi:MAG: HlyC/CorC family transporter [Gemmatimonadales bacterium]|jgi:CBS domain containing-hemolysin-like protein|nr:MAG: HlyC/CorC family transporter [Gemmatimonadales bacterium]